MQRMSYVYKTENSYCDWVKRFIKFSQMQDRGELFVGVENKVEVFLTDLAVGHILISSIRKLTYFPFSTI
ncbi:hypothetical protein THERMOT_2007 [Bathymodiolus thermophilus thioautotrophic gill symbiont]|uniref:phage integrase N-terminal SAM-like domain-containing protein n=1 Tax=Bathymodiolus thermophilus thioautotrophic gill symbiont TaxID=2360 RepID=UPI001A2F61B5|nr:hypothetical protein THERMOT_2007 [Bathymodiolus thermophilus thioautotrophic gill symbiont]